MRSVVEHRINQPSAFVEAEILGRFHASNAKKIGLPAVQVGNKATTLAGGRTYFQYSVAQFLKDVKSEFDDTFSLDVYKNWERKDMQTIPLQYILRRIIMEKNRLTLEELALLRGVIEESRNSREIGRASKCCSCIHTQDQGMKCKLYPERIPRDILLEREVCKEFKQK